MSRFFFPVGGRLVRLLLAITILSAPLAPEEANPQTSQKQILQYGVEWRLIRAGTARLTWMPLAGSYQGDLDILSSGIVSKLHRVDDRYTVQLEEELCARTVYLRAQEGKRNRETRVSFDKSAGRISYLEKDLIKNQTVLQKEIEAAGCVFEYVGGLQKLRNSKLEPGHSTTVPMSDGKKFAQVRVEAQEREKVKTPSGTYQAMRYEIHMMNGALVQRHGRVFVWIAEDERRLPVQLRVRLSLLVGSITLQLERIE